MKLNQKDFQSDDLVGTQWVGIIEDNVDPLFEGRCKIRVLGKFDIRLNNNKENDYIIPTNSLPWARQTSYTTGGSETGSGSFDVPKLGSKVKVTFDSGNIYSPLYHENLYSSDELKKEIENSYENAHVLLYDTAFGLKNNNNEISNEREGEGIKIFFTEEKGLVIDYATTEGSSVINIKNDNSIEVTNANGDSIIMSNDGNITFKHSGTLTINASKDVEINCENAKINASKEAHINSPRIKLGEQAAEAVIKGDTFRDIFDNHIHPTGVGPTGKPTTSATPSLSTKNTTD